MTENKHSSPKHADKSCEYQPLISTTSLSTNRSGRYRVFGEGGREGKKFSSSSNDGASFTPDESKALISPGVNPQMEKYFLNYLAAVLRH